MCLNLCTMMPFRSVDDGRPSATASHVISIFGRVDCIDILTFLIETPSLTSTQCYEERSSWSESEMPGWNEICRTVQLTHALFELLRSHGLDCLRPLKKSGKKFGFHDSVLIHIVKCVTSGRIVVNESATSFNRRRRGE